MSSSQDNDDQQRFALGFLFALIALVVATVVGVVVYKRAIAPARAPAAAVVAAPEAGTVAVAPEVVDGPTIQVDNGVVKFYFASGKTDVAPGADEALADVAKGVIMLETRNLERLGSALYTLRPQAIDQALLDHFGHLVLGQPNRFRELAKR